jgi:UDP-glucose 4-epimerase
MTDSSIIVTGGAGFIGSNLVEALSKDNSVIVLDNLHTGSRDNISGPVKSGVKFLKKDARDIGEIKEKVSCIYHLGFYSASPMYRENPHLVAEVIDGMISVLELARKNDCPVVFSSTSSIYNGIKPPHREDVIPGVTDYYTEGRIEAERLSELYYRLYGLNVSAMRFFSVYGFHEDAKHGYANLATQFMKAMIKNEQPVIYGDGTQRRDFVFVTDVVDALLKASTSKGFEVYNVGSGVNYSLNELVDKINNLLGSSISAKYIEMLLKNYVMETLADTTKASRKLGFKAKIDLDSGLRTLAKYYGAK